MFPPKPSSIIVSLLLSSHMIKSETIDPKLLGTWTTKSRAVFTGPGFYDPLNDRFIEPNLTGISYSFASTGHYETAYFRAIPNPRTPQCPQAILQYQHGAFITHSGPTLNLTPIAQDGRQLLSDPCAGGSTLSRYAQPENISSYSVVRDRYNDEWRLDMLAWDGTPMLPMWLALRPPVMLPTTPFERKEGGRNRLRRRDGGNATGTQERSTWDSVMWPSTQASAVFWIGVGMTGVGGVLFLYF